MYRDARSDTTSSLPVFSGLTHLEYLLVLGVAGVAGTLSGIIGTGSSLLLMPVLVLLYGPWQAVPIMAIAAVMGNVGKVLAWRRVVDWRACAAYGATAAPGAAIGAASLLVIPQRIVELALGVFFLAMIPLRRWLAHKAWHFTPTHLALIGGPVGFLTGIVVSTGPITVPIFLAYGLVKGGLLATEAAGSLLVYGVKVTVFRRFGALPASIILKGLMAGSALMTGSFLARYVVVRLTTDAFRLLVDGLMLASGLSLLWAALLR